jgi:hypothetical protein
MIRGVELYSYGGEAMVGVTFADGRIFAAPVAGCLGRALRSIVERYREFR